jgi:hypothetical protein
VLLLTWSSAHAAVTQPAVGEPALAETVLDVRDFQFVPSQSGPVDYYELVEDPSGSFIRATYRPPLKTAVLGIEIPERVRSGVRKVRWRWRAMSLPANGHDCRGPTDSAAAVYLTFRSGLKWYTLKYVWSAVGPVGVACVQARNLFTGQVAIVLRAGGPTGEWRSEEVDPAAEFRKHFRRGDPGASIPDLAGIGIMTDGDQTQSLSAADYGAFSVLGR